jgi:aldose 1-epimerase
VHLAAGDARLDVDPGDGGRWTALEIAGLQLLGGADIPDGHPATLHGCFAMAPFAGRLRDGLLPWRGEVHQLPLHAAPHALHGTAVDAGWRVVEATRTTAVLEHDLAAPWPFAGTVRQELTLSDDRLDVRLSLRAGEDQPVTLGLHPWFARRLSRGGSAELGFEPVQQYARGDDGLPTGELVPPRPGPHDDCFLGVRTPPRILWPGALALELVSPVEHWVLFDEREEAVALEPQTGPPDAVHLGQAHVVAAGREHELALTLRWTRL